MADIQVVSNERHGQKRWRKPLDYGFAAHDTIASIVIQEVPKVMMATAIAFIKADTAFMPVSLQGLENGQNLFLGPYGEWLGGYIPAVYRCYPFKLAKNDAGNFVLCIDEESALLTDDPADQRFFSDEGKPSAAITEIFELMMKIERDRNKTQQACALLATHGLIEDWPLHVQAGDDIRKIDGLYRISEQALNKVEAPALLELRDCGALMLAYSQLLSIQHIHKLGELNAGGKPAAASKPIRRPQARVFEDNGIVSFENL